MKVLHVPFSYFPDPPGGTELYVAALVREQLAAGWAPTVAAAGTASGQYMQDGVPVFRFAPEPNPALSQLWGDGDPVALLQLERIVETVRPELVHLHSRTPAVSALATRMLKRRGIPVVFTYHTPTSSCPRGTLRRWGSVTCDGLLLDHRCGACVIAAQGAPRAAAIAIEPLARLAAKGASEKSGGMWTALRLPALVSEYKRATLEFLNSARQIMVMADWCRQVLEINGIPATRITMIPHGLLNALEPQPARAADGTVKLGFFGRLDPAKGLHLVIEALARQPDLPVTLEVYAIRQAGDADAYAQEVIRRAARDSRIEFAPPVMHQDMGTALARLDAVVVPSVSLETGPLVVLEAFAVRRPVIGTRIGGIADKVTHELNGLLVEPDADAWLETLTRIALDPEVLPRLAAGTRPPRSMKAISDEIQSVYARVLR